MGAAPDVRTLALALALPLALACAAACGSSAAGVDACKQVESARCRAAPTCGVSLEPPYSTAGGNVDACIRFYDVACLHGLASGSDPGPAAVSACVAAIADHPCNKGGPDLVLSPEKDPTCAWLVPAGTPAAEAGASSSEAGDAPSE